MKNTTRTIGTGNFALHLFVGVALTSLSLAASTLASAQPTPVEIERGQNGLFSSRVLTTALSNPWAMRWGPDGMIWLTERSSGEVTAVDPESGAQQVILTIADVYSGVTQDGLLGMALHPELGQGSGNDFVFIGYTINGGSVSAPDAVGQIVRYTYDAATRQLGAPAILIAGLPAGNDHNAGRVVIGPDMKLYFSIGEQGANFGRNFRLPNLAQALPSAEEVAAGDWHSYSGKILRLELDGAIPKDNPEIEGVRSHIYSYGHRNPQGLAFGANGILYESEHGPSSDDELNIIESGGNYGWPLVAGFIDDMAYSYNNWSAAPADVERIVTPPPASVPQTAESAFAGDMVDPLATYFTVASDFPIGVPCGFVCNPTVGPSSIVHYNAGTAGITEWNNSILLPTLKHGVVYVQALSADGTQAEGLPVAWLGTQNRYRDVLVAPGGRDVYIATDAFGSVAQLYGSGMTTSVLHNPGSILKFTYGGEEGVALAVTMSAAGASGVTESGGGPEEGETAANQSVAPGTDTAPAGDAATAVGGGQADLATLMRAGQPKYVARCSTCHGVNGRGSAGTVLVDNRNLADAGKVAATIIHGLGYMAPLGANLADADIAEIGSYIRNAWGNDHGLLTVDQAAAAR
jgi:PQQ-dependent dehydrogenase (s-GDH family)